MQNSIDIFKQNYLHDNVIFNKKLTTAMKVGGVVLALVCPKTDEQILDCLEAAKKANLKYYVCGNLSNTIIKDSGFSGIVIKLFDNYSGYTQQKNCFTVKSGTSLIAFASKVTKMGYGGLEFAGGIPGSCGGAVVMNAGAYGGQMSDCVTKVKAICDGNIKTFTKDELEFGYRKSIFSTLKDCVILSVEFTLKEGSGDISKLTDFNRQRKEKQPLNLPNCGSTFKRNDSCIPAKLIEDLGLKGLRVGGASISTKHSGFIVNDKDATAKDVLELMEKVKEIVKDKTDIALECEWVIIGE